MEQIAKQLLKRISEKASTLTDKKISQVAHAPKENEWRAFISQAKPHWEDIAWRVKEPNSRGEAEVHLGFYTAKPAEELTQAITRAEELAKGKVNHVIKNENGIHLVWKVNLNDSNSLDKLFEDISNLMSSFLDIAFGALLKSNSHEEETVDLNESNQEIAELSKEQINSIDGIHTIESKSPPAESNLNELILKFEDKFLELYPCDLELKMNWHDATQTAKAIGQDWRLPSLSEFKIIFDALHKIDKIKFDESTSYWSNEEVEGKENWAWSFYFDCGKPFDDTKEYESMVRLVRNIEY